MKRLVIGGITMVIGLVLVLWALPLIGAWAQPAAPTKAIVLKAVMSWSDPFAVNPYFHKFVDRVNERGVGKVEIKLLGGAEVVAPLEGVKNQKVWQWSNITWILRRTGVLHQSEPDRRRGD